jgi:putative phosphoesterase
VPARAILVGIISDTHGLLRPEAVAALRGTDVIVHAGDVGNADIIEQLRRIAPLFVVRGNIDQGNWAERLPIREVVSIGELKFLLLHQVAELALDPQAEGYAAVVYGHSHVPSMETRDNVLFLNPGSAGPRRFQLPVTIARARVRGRRIDAEIVHLPV